jgi:hypothetical protein
MEYMSRSHIEQKIDGDAEIASGCEVGSVDDHFTCYEYIDYNILTEDHLSK